MPVFEVTIFPPTASARLCQEFRFRGFVGDQSNLHPIEEVMDRQGLRELDHSQITVIIGADFGDRWFIEAQSLLMGTQFSRAMNRYGLNLGVRFSEHVSMLFSCGVSRTTMLCLQVNSELTK